MTLGSVPDDCIAGGASNTHELELKMNHDDWWTVRMRDFKYGDKSIQSSGTELAILDSGTSYISISQSDYENFARKILKLDGMQCSLS